jgi:hypothetical protein
VSIALIVQCEGWRKQLIPNNTCGHLCFHEIYNWTLVRPVSGRGIKGSSMFSFLFLYFSILL